MRLLLDTHIFIWWADEPERLSPFILDALLNPDNVLVLSVVSLWEMQIKAQLGKLTMRQPLEQLILTQQSINNLELLPVWAQHIFTLDRLPMHHKDPFDRMIISQSIVEGLTVVTIDKIFSSYSVMLLK